ncbi:DNA-binding protein WhiA [[Mycoplasma] testudinis]|uniref:DNA-binding protein WhiA n=1 Tax=[Mycoplasma] testudinis TaxID=33924 RepID=UPI00048611AA|nr:DNA-binding protein WhiA [[Mycoplasma] testudinis]
MRQTFSETVKSELCRQEFQLDCVKYLLRSFLLNNLTQKDILGTITWKIQTHFSFLARFLIKWLKELYDFKQFKVSLNQPKNITTRREISVSLVGNFQQISTDLDLNAPLVLKGLDKNCLRAFVVGAFLSRGSINDPQNGNYHLEFVSDSKTYIDFLNLILKKFGINKTQVITRNMRYVLYLKRSETIADVLRLMGSVETLFKYEDLRIGRDLANNMQRLNNLDISNLKKTVSSSNEIFVMIQALEQANELQKMPLKLQVFCQIVLEKQELSLAALAAEMSSRLKTNISRSGVAHLKNKIKELFKQLH